MVALKDNEVLTGVVRLSYVSLAEKYTDKNGKSRYQATLIIPKTDTQTLEAIERARLVALNTGIAKGKLLPGTTLAHYRSTIHDGDTEPNYSMWAGCKIITVSNAQNQPNMFDVDGRRLVCMSREEPDGRVIYSGCYAKVRLSFSAFNSDSNKGVTGYIDGVRKWADGEPLAGGSNVSADDFGEGFDTTVLPDEPLLM
jgi:hypothetical protein